MYIQVFWTCCHNTLFFVQDLTPSDLMMKEINALYVMRIPYDWKVFCDNMVEGLLQVGTFLDSKCQAKFKTTP